MSFRSYGAALVMGILAASAASRAAPAGAQDAEKEQEHRKDRVPYVAPAGQMGKLRFLVGRWRGTETWEDPGKWKRPGYEGYPGPGGFVTRAIEEGPGGFSVVWTEEGRGPMGGYTGRAMLAWDPAANVYVLDRVHSLFPGIARLTGNFDKESLVFRGEDRSTGERRVLELRMTPVPGGGWSETLEASAGSGPARPVMTARFEKAP